MNRLIAMGEVRLSLRLIAKQPILSATIILALATGICMVMIGVTFRDMIVNGKLPYAAGDRFARLVAFDRDGDRVDPDVERYHAFRDRATSFEHVGAAIDRSFTVARSSRSGPRWVRRGRVSSASCSSKRCCWDRSPLRLGPAPPS
jgi:hypothetical protein